MYQVVRESLNDTIKTIENYADIIVMRHSDNDIFDNIENKKLLINAGNGTNEHPTQSLTDLLTICYCCYYSYYYSYSFY